MSDWRALMTQPLWMEWAACRGMDPDLFFPARGEATLPVKATCRRCDVQSECLAYAMNSGERFGIWGGMSERERRGLRRRFGAPAPAPPSVDHGTNAGYAQHLYRDEAACALCLRAHADYERFTRPSRAHPPEGAA